PPSFYRLRSKSVKTCFLSQKSCSQQSQIGVTKLLAIGNAEQHAAEQQAVKTFDDTDDSVSISIQKTLHDRAPLCSVFTSSNGLHHGAFHFQRAVWLRPRAALCFLCVSALNGLHTTRTLKFTKPQP